MKPKLKPRGKPFQKGKPGGPGRPKGLINGSTRAKEYLEQEGGWDKLLALVNSNSESIRLETLKTLLDRAYGKAPSNVSLEVGEKLAQILSRSWDPKEGNGGG